MQYVGHDPLSKGDLLRIRMEPTSLCVGAPPSLAENSEQHRPLDAEAAQLVSIDYDGNAPGNAYLTFQFEDEVRYSVVSSATSDLLSVRVYLPTATESAPVVQAAPARLRTQAAAPRNRYVINLESRQRPPGTADLPKLDPVGDREVFVTEAVVDGTTWYRIRLGYFDSAEDAGRELRNYRSQYPNAWIDRDVPGQSKSSAAVVTPTAAPLTAAAGPWSRLKNIRMPPRTKCLKRQAPATTRSNS